MYEEIFNAAESISCQYYDEEQFISKNRNGDEFLNILTLNIRSLPKHGGELYVYLESLNTNFDVIILTEIGARNLSVVQKLLPNFTFFYSPPIDSSWGGVGIYLSKSLTNTSTLDAVKIKRNCDCSKCQIESLFVEFKFNGMMYSIGGIYRHPNGNVSHFVSALELLLNELDNCRTTIIAGDMNKDIIKFTNIDVISYMTTSKFRVTGLCEGNPAITDGFPSQRVSKAENVCIWWRHYVTNIFHGWFTCLGQSRVLARSQRRNPEKYR